MTLRFRCRRDSVYGGALVGFRVFSLLRTEFAPSSIVFSYSRILVLLCSRTIYKKMLYV